MESKDQNKNLVLWIKNLGDLLLTQKITKDKEEKTLDKGNYK